MNQPIKPPKIMPNQGAAIEDGFCKDTDEVFGHGHLHIEQMSDTKFWARLYSTTGKDVVMWFSVNEDGHIVLSSEYE